MKKNFLGKACVLLFTICMAVCCSVLFFACDKDKPSDQQQGVVLSKTTATIPCYEQLTLTATAKGDVTWKSSNTEVATVDGGIVSALKVGTADITATCGEDSATCVVTVVESTVEPLLVANNTDVSVYEGYGDYDVTVTPTWNGNPVTEAVEYNWAFAPDKPTDVANYVVGENTNTIKITGAKLGETAITVSATVRGKTATETIKVTVKELKLSASLTTNSYLTVSSTENVNYDANLCLVATDTTATEVDAVLTISLGATDVTDKVTPTWTSASESIAKFDSGKIKGLAEGETNITVSATYTEGALTKSGSIVIHVTVSKLSVSLNDVLTVETANLQPITLSQDVNGTVEKLTLKDGTTDLKSSYANKVITLNGANLPKKVADGMGDEKEVVLTTDKATYSFKLNIYTKVLKTKADIDGMGGLAKTAANDGGNTWDGYFVLGNDIDYNGTFAGMFGTANVWTSAGNIDSNGNTRGFKGVFDGKGYNIDKMSIEKNTTSGAGSGFIPNLMAAGVIQNVSFTNASVKDCGFITSWCSTGATYKNIYVQYKALIGDAADTATFNPGGHITTNATYIFIDGSQLETYTNSSHHWARARLMDRKAGEGAFKNPNCYGVLNGSVAVGTDNQESYHIIAPDVATFKAKANGEYVISNWDTSFWDISTGMPIPKNLMNK